MITYVVTGACPAFFIISMRANHHAHNSHCKMFYSVFLVFATFSTTCKQIADITYSLLRVTVKLHSSPLVAAVDLVIVGNNNVLCTGASVTLQCTLTGNVLTWNTPDGALNFVRGRQVESNAGSYYGQLVELNATHLQSTLSFIFTAEITINCSDTTASNSATLVVEGIASRFGCVHPCNNYL